MASGRLILKCLYLVLACVCAAAQAQDFRPHSGLWWNPERAGHGIDLHFSGDRMFLVWYTYDERRLPTWLVAAAPLDGTSWSAPLQATRWDHDQRVVTDITDVGSIAFDFLDAERAVLSWEIDGDSGSELFRKFVFAEGIPQRSLRGQIYDPDESGWGLTVDSEGAVHVAVLYYYDEAGLPTWAIGSTADGGEETLAFEMLFVAPGFRPSDPAIPIAVETVGTLELTPSSASGRTSSDRKGEAVDAGCVAYAGLQAGGLGSNAFGIVLEACMVALNTGLVPAEIFTIPQDGSATRLAPGGLLSVDASLVPDFDVDLHWDVRADPPGALDSAVLLPFDDSLQVIAGDDAGTITVTVRENDEQIEASVVTLFFEVAAPDVPLSVALLPSSQTLAPGEELFLTPRLTGGEPPVEGQLRRNGGVAEPIFLEGSTVVTFPAPGEQELCLEVDDALGQSAAHCISVRVRDDVPLPVRILGPSRVAAGQPATHRLSASPPSVFITANEDQGVGSVTSVWNESGAVFSLRVSSTPAKGEEILARRRVTVEDELPSQIELIVEDQPLALDVGEEGVVSVRAAGGSGRYRVYADHVEAGVVSADESMELPVRFDQAPADGSNHWTLVISAADERYDPARPDLVSQFVEIADAGASLVDFLTLEIVETDDDATVELLVRLTGGEPNFDIQIDWGDGSTDTLRGSDTADPDSPLVLTISHDYEGDGRYLIRALARDGAGNRANAEASLTLGMDFSVAVTTPELDFLPTFARFNALIAGGEPPFDVVLEWGDGEQSSEQAQEGRTVSFFRSLTRTGIYTAVATVTDSAGSIVASAPLRYRVGGEGPFLIMTQPQGDECLEVQATDPSFDPEASTLTLSGDPARPTIGWTQPTGADVVAVNLTDEQRLVYGVKTTAINDALAPPVRYGDYTIPGTEVLGTRTDNPSPDLTPGKAYRAYVRDDASSGIGNCRQANLQFQVNPPPLN